MNWHVAPFVRTPVVGAAPFIWQQLKIGGGGFVTGLQIAPNGNQFCRTDTSGAYVRQNSAQAWQLVVTRQSMPSTYTNFGPNAPSGNGVYAIAIAPSLTTRLYMYWNNLIFRSNDFGTTWTLTGFSSVTADPNNQGNPTTRLSGPYMAVDPANPDIVYASTPSSGLWKTTNGGTSWTQVTTVGTATNGGGTQGQGHLIVFDPSSSVVSNVTQGIYVSTYGTGIYHSSDGGATWSLLNSAGMPTTHRQLDIGSDGTLWIVDGSGSGGAVGSLLRYNGAWSTQIATSGTAQLAAVAVDPANSARVFAGDYHGNLFGSTNATAGTPTWFGPTAFTINSPSIPWQTFAADAALSNAVFKFDKTQTNALYSGAGIGIFKTAPPNSNVSVTWDGSEGAGIENLSTNYGVSVPGGPLELVSQDRPLWLVTNPGQYQNQYYPSATPEIDNPSSTCDWSSATNLLGNAHTRATFSTINGGTSWSTAATEPSPFPATANAGNMVMASATNWLYLLSDDAGPYFTTDSGTTWTGCSITGATLTGGGWHHAFFYFSRKAACVDRVDGTVYLYNDGTGTNAAGIYSASSVGGTFTKVHAGALGLNTSVNFKMDSVPGQAGHLFASASADYHNASLPTADGFYHSTDHGATWTTLSNVASLFSWGFGQAKPGGSGYPAVFIAGWVSGVYGIWRSDNCDQAIPTWTQIGDGFPIGIFDAISFVCGDMNIYGKCYVGFGGTGFAFYG